jgi:hypothetical protein
MADEHLGPRRTVLYTSCCEISIGRRSGRHGGGVLQQGSQGFVTARCDDTRAAASARHEGLLD